MNRGTQTQHSGLNDQQRGQPASPRPAATWWAWAFPTALAAVLGLYRVGVPMLWRDELASWSAASRTLPQLWRMVHNIDAVLGPYYFGLHLWMAVFGDSVVAMRLPSVLAMTAATTVIALTGRRLGSPGTGLVSGLVFALIPSVSRYAQEARPYALAVLFAALATLLLLLAAEHPRWITWAGYALALAAAGAANLVALSVVTAHAAVLAATSWQGTKRAAGTAEAGNNASARSEEWLIPAGWLPGFSVSVAAAGILDAPLLITGHAQSLAQIGRQPRPYLAQLLGLHGGIWAELFGSTPVAVVVVALAVAAVVVPGNRAVGARALLGAVTPVLAVWAISHRSASYWTFRYLLFTLPAWALAAGFGITGIAAGVGRSRLGKGIAASWPRVVVAAGLVALVGLLGIGGQWGIRQPESHNEWAYPVAMDNGRPVNYPGAAAVIEANQRPGDGIVYQVSDQNHYQVDTSIAYYLRGKPAPRPVFQKLTQAAAGTLQPVQCADPARCLPGTPRLWVVYVDRLVPDGTLDPFAAMLPREAAYLKLRGYRVAAQYPEDGITVALLTVA